MQDDTLFDSQNAAYAQAMFEEYARNPDAVPSEWRKLFDDGGDLAVSEGLLVPDQMVDSRTGSVQPASAAEAPEPAPAPPPAALPGETDEDSRALLELLPAVSRATALVQAFRDHGHLLASIDPLGSEPPGHPQLSPAFHGTSADELLSLIHI